MFHRWRSDDDLVQSARHRGTVHVASQHLQSRTVDSRLALLVVCIHVDVQHVVQFFTFPVASRQ